MQILMTWDRELFGNAKCAAVTVGAGECDRPATQGVFGILIIWAGLTARAEAVPLCERHAEAYREISKT